MVTYPTDTPGKTGMGYTAPAGWWVGKDQNWINAILNARDAGRAFWWSTPQPHVGPLYAGAGQVVKPAGTYTVKRSAPPPGSPATAPSTSTRTVPGGPQMSFFSTLGSDLLKAAPVIGGIIGGPAGAAIGTGIEGIAGAASSPKPMLQTTPRPVTPTSPYLPGQVMGGPYMPGVVTVGTQKPVTTGQTVLPAVGAALGGIIGDVPGALIGGAAGEASAKALDAFLSSRSGSGSASGMALGVQPTVVGQRVDANGKQNPIRKCPKGFVLAFNDMCYPKQMLPRSFRKWKPAPRPAVSRRDQRAIRQADRARKRLIKLTKQSGAYAAEHKPKPRTSRSTPRQAIEIVQAKD